MNTHLFPFGINAVLNPCVSFGIHLPFVFYRNIVLFYLFLSLGNSLTWALLTKIA